MSNLATGANGRPAASGMQSCSNGSLVSTSIIGPTSTRALSKKEQIIVLKGSKLHGYVFPPWRDPFPDDFDLKDGEPFMYAYLV